MPTDNETLHSIGRKNWTVIAKNIYVPVMGYDFHSYKYPPFITGNNSNLYNDPSEPAIDGFYHISVNQGIKYLTYLGVPANKIILGCPAYFIAYGGVRDGNHGLYQPFNSQLTPHYDYGVGKGAYLNIVNLLKQGFHQHIILLNNKVSAVYANNPHNKQWLSYENPSSILEKANYVNTDHLAGMMLWNIKQDLPASNPASLLSSMFSGLNHGHYFLLKKQLTAFENHFNGRFGVYFYDSNNNHQFSYHAHQRFPMCSTAKLFVVADILKMSISNPDILSKKIYYTRKDLSKAEWTPITKNHLNSGMTIKALCVAAIEYSDNAAMNA